MNGIKGAGDEKKSECGTYLEYSKFLESIQMLKYLVQFKVVESLLGNMHRNL